MDSQNLCSCGLIIKGVQAKNLKATPLFIDFSKVLDSIHRGKRSNTTSIWSSKKTVTTIMMLYKNVKAMVCSPDGDTDFFHIFIGVLQGDTLAPLSVYNLPRLCTRNFNRSNKRKWFYIKKDKKQNISHRNYDRSRLYR